MMEDLPGRLGASAVLDDRGSAATAPGTAPAGPAPTLRPLPDDALIVLPVRNLVVFPTTVLPIAIGRERSQAAVQKQSASSGRSASCCRASPRSRSLVATTCTGSAPAPPCSAT
jgi:hypothetical protein